MLTRLAVRCDELGVPIRLGATTYTRPGVHQAPACVVRGTTSQDYQVIVGPEAGLADAHGAAGHDAPRLLFTTYASPKTSDALRRAGVQYLDTAGNAWIEFADVLIDIRGRRRQEAAGAGTHAHRGNLFSAGRSQVVFALLAWPALWESPQRDVARAAGVSLGQANNTLVLLHEAGFGPHRHRADQTTLLELWAAAFPQGLAQRLTVATFSGDVGQLEKVDAGDAIFLSGAGAVPELLRPASLTLYVEAFDARLVVKNRWRTDGPRNILVRRKFWQPPHDEGLRVGFQTAPWPLVYADLLASDDPRVRQAASTWRDRVAGRQ
jgi:hypothetical protein